ncbi:MAG: YigZ family protein [Candidatus Marinimicrobia bacterium]|nr:YigZ family protein [Candidatus Neomarinimicrobiota bacterium]
MKTPAKLSESIYKEKGSKFLGFLIPIASEKDFRSELKVLTRKYHDTTHICYAYRLLPISGDGNICERKSDGGEPSGTAGDPILRQLQENQVVNGALVVIRYFGGTKLGKGGLSRAFRTCASKVINSSELVMVVHTVSLMIECNQNLLGQLENLIYNSGGRIVSRKFDKVLEKVGCKIEISKDKYEKIRKAFKTKFSEGIYFLFSNSV